MKKLLVIFSMFLSTVVFAQDPVKWSFTSKKISGNTYEIHITAMIQSPWSIYSQSTPDGGPLPTMFSFGKNPLVKLEGNVKEQGDLKKKFEEVFAVDVLYYKDKVDFVQKITIKNNIKTNITGKLEYMACNDEQCLPPKEIPFSIAIK